jgi:hypothetical protein
MCITTHSSENVKYENWCSYIAVMKISVLWDILLCRFWYSYQCCEGTCYFCLQDSARNTCCVGKNWYYIEGWARWAVWLVCQWGMEVALSSVPGPYGIYRKMSRGEKNIWDGWRIWEISGVKRGRQNWGDQECSQGWSRKHIIDLWSKTAVSWRGACSNTHRCAQVPKGSDRYVCARHN